MTDKELDPELEVALLLSDAKHPIWKIMLGLVAVLSALWMNGSV